jgi:hypothetical protein
MPPKMWSAKIFGWSQVTVSSAGRYNLALRSQVTQHQIVYCSTVCSMPENKSLTTAPVSPLHLLPIPDTRRDSIAMDFIGPLPEDDGFNMILTITDCLGHVDIWIIPIRMDMSAADTALLLYNNWYLENGLPLDIVSDHDPCFVADLWKAFCRLTHVKQKMSSVHHHRQMVLTKCQIKLLSSASGSMLSITSIIPALCQELNYN